MAVNRSQFSGFMGTCGTGIWGVDAVILVLVVEYDCCVAGIEGALKALWRRRENFVMVVIWLKESFMGL